MSSSTEKPWFKMYPDHVKETINHPEYSLYTMLEKTVTKYKDNIGIIYDGKKITYGQMKSNVDNLAGAWHHLGLRKGSRIGLMLSNNPYYIYAYFAAMKLGLIVVQVNPNYTLRELLNILKDSTAEYLVTEEDNRTIVNQMKEMYEITVFFTKKTSENESNSISELLTINKFVRKKVPINVKDDVAVIQYTGGTSGIMKGAMLTHYNLIANIEQTYNLYDGKMKPGKEVVLTATPLYHVYAMTSAMNFGIYTGSTIVLMEKFETNYALYLIEKYKPTFFPGVPKMYSAFVNTPNISEYNLSSLEYCSCGSAPIPIEVIKRFETLTNAVIGEGFGLTETSPTSHRNPPGGVRKTGSVGIPIPNTDSKIVDETGKELPNGSIGELIIKGPQVMKGYWNNLEETSKALINGWLYTGDLARQDKEGYFYVVGRKKEMIIVGGFNIFPQEVENIIYEFPDVSEAAVVGLPNESEEIVSAYVAPKCDRYIDVKELEGFCYRNLTPYKVPKRFIIVESLPRNAVGKILKRKLIEIETKTNYKS